MKPLKLHLQNVNAFTKILYLSLIHILKTRKNSLEREANEFACRFLLHDIDLKKIENIDFIIKERGIPIKIWRSVCEYIIS